MKSVGMCVCACGVGEVVKKGAEEGCVRVCVCVYLCVYKNRHDELMLNAS